MATTKAGRLSCRGRTRDNRPWAYFDVPGTPFIVIAKSRRVIWENSMNAPDVLLDRLLAVVAGGEPNRVGSEGSQP